MRIAPLLYKYARIVNDIEALISLNPTRIMRRIKNKFIGRALGRTNIYRTIFK